MRELYPIAECPFIQRDLYIARALRAKACALRAKDKPQKISTLEVDWGEVVVSFESDDLIAKAVVSVAKEAKLAEIAPELEQILDCFAPGEGEWVIKLADKISRYGKTEDVRIALCDRVILLDPETGETVGALKRKRRSVKLGYGSVRLVPQENTLQLVLRHPSAQGLKALWKSVFFRINNVRR